MDKCRNQKQRNFVTLQEFFCYYYGDPPIRLTSSVGSAFAIFVALLTNVHFCLPQIHAPTPQ